ESLYYRHLCIHIASKPRGNHLRLGGRYAPQIRLQLGLKQRNLFRGWCPIWWRNPKHATGAGALRRTKFQYVRQLGRHPKSICSPLIMRYAAVGNLLLRDTRYWYPRTPTEINSLFQQQAEATSYDSWRYPQLKAFALKTLG